jgi:hypothetical protein
MDPNLAFMVIVLGFIIIIVLLARNQDTAKMMEQAFFEGVMGKLLMLLVVIFLMPLVLVVAMGWLMFAEPLSAGLKPRLNPVWKQVQVLAAKWTALASPTRQTIGLWQETRPTPQNSYLVITAFLKLLALFPPKFRHKYGDQIILEIEGQFNEALTKSYWRATLVSLKLSKDLLFSAAVEWLRVLRGFHLRGQN